ncbi:hypothetical protein Q8A67_021581 [Cirrhinus molitorella]|uniref:Secreted protein n=1 Tax=Cirrhinus molitorella TaxID=172907 RepID=A0AA88P606_9TELE|nr:hypothetical protein Q8A67_021581 [Cirrhinus molitorella]
MRVGLAMQAEMRAVLLAPVLSAACQSLLGQPEPREQSGTGPKSRGGEWVSITVSSSQGRKSPPTSPTCAFTGADIWAALELSSN